MSTMSWGRGNLREELLQKTGLFGKEILRFSAPTLIIGIVAGLVPWCFSWALDSKTGGEIRASFTHPMVLVIVANGVAFLLGLGSGLDEQESGARRLLDTLPIHPARVVASKLAACFLLSVLLACGLGMLLHALVPTVTTSNHKPVNADWFGRLAFYGMPGEKSFDIRGLDFPIPELWPLAMITSLLGAVAVGLAAGAWFRDFVLAGTMAALAYILYQALVPVAFASLLPSIPGTQSHEALAGLGMAGRNLVFILQVAVACHFALAAYRRPGTAAAKPVNGSGTRASIRSFFSDSDEIEKSLRKRPRRGFFFSPLFRFLALIVVLVISFSVWRTIISGSEGTAKLLILGISTALCLALGPGLWAITHWYGRRPGKLPIYVWPQFYLLNFSFCVATVLTLACAFLSLFFMEVHVFSVGLSVVGAAVGANSWEGGERDGLRGLSHLLPIRRDRLVAGRLWAVIWRTTAIAFWGMIIQGVGLTVGLTMISSIPPIDWWNGWTMLPGIFVPLTVLPIGATVASALALFTGRRTIIIPATSLVVLCWVFLLVESWNKSAGMWGGMRGMTLPPLLWLVAVGIGLPAAFAYWVAVHSPLLLVRESRRGGLLVGAVLFLGAWGCALMRIQPFQAWGLLVGVGR